MLANVAGQSAGSRNERVPSVCRTSRVLLGVKATPDTADPFTTNLDTAGPFTRPTWLFASIWASHSPSGLTET